MKFFATATMLLCLSLSQVLAQPVLGLEAMQYRSFSATHIPPAFSPLESDGTDFGNDFGVGLFLVPHENVKLRAGYFRWTKIFNAKFDGTFATLVMLEDGTLHESGALTSSGIYALASTNSFPVFVEAGFALSFSKSYNADIRIVLPNTTLGSSDQSESAIAEKFNAQHDFLFGLGAEIPAGSRLLVRPNIQASIPIGELFPTNVQTYDPLQGERVEAHISIFVVRFGITLQYGLRSS